MNGDKSKTIIIVKSENIKEIKQNSKIHRWSFLKKNENGHNAIEDQENHIFTLYYLI